MLSPDLIVTLLVLIFGALCTFVGYWRGFSAGRQDGRIETERLYDELDETTRILGEIAAARRHPSNRLRVVREES